MQTSNKGLATLEVGRFYVRLRDFMEAGEKPEPCQVFVNWSNGSDKWEADVKPFMTGFKDSWKEEFSTGDPFHASLRDPFAQPATVGLSVEEIAEAAYDGIYGPVFRTLEEGIKRHWIDRVRVSCETGDFNFSPTAFASNVQALSRFLAPAPPEPLPEGVTQGGQSVDEFLRAIRARGWSVAVHNDYKQEGVHHTFWLFTKDGKAVKGEGPDDVTALKDVIIQLRLTDGVIEHEREPAPVEEEQPAYEEARKLWPDIWEKATGHKSQFAEPAPPATESTQGTAFDQDWIDQCCGKPESEKGRVEFTVGQDNHGCWCVKDPRGMITVTATKLECEYTVSLINAALAEKDREIEQLKQQIKEQKDWSAR